MTIHGMVQHTLYIGIDPGLRGALAVIDEALDVIALHDAVPPGPVRICPLSAPHSSYSGTRKGDICVPVQAGQRRARPPVHEKQRVSMSIAREAFARGGEQKQLLILFILL